MGERPELPVYEKYILVFDYKLRCSPGGTDAAELDLNPDSELPGAEADAIVEESYFPIVFSPQFQITGDLSEERLFFYFHCLSF